MTLPTQPTQPRATTAIDRIANEYTERLLELDPGFATELGRAGHESEYRDHSPAGLAALADAARSTLAALAAAEPVDEVDAVTVHAMAERLGLEVELHETGWPLAELNNIASPAQGIRAIFDLMPTATAADWQHIAERMANVPAAVGGYIASLRAGAERGLVASARQVKIVIGQCERHAAADGFFTTMTQQAALDADPGTSGTDAAGTDASDAGRQLPADLAEVLAANAEIARGGYGTLVAFLRDELLPQAPEEDAVGHERYQLASREFLGARIDLEESYAWGVAELDRIVAEQEVVAEAIKPGASIEEAKALLNADPARQLQGTAALTAWMQQLSDTALAELAGSQFDIPEVMRTLECRIAPTQDGGIYYTGPSEDFSRPGRMWWSVPEGEDSFTTWAETTTVYHEGVPGHHLQVATATYQSALLNDWRRNVSWVSGHGEGWALYAERLMDDLGYLADPGDKMGMLDGQRMRAARVVFDIGVHLKLPVPARWGTGNWTAEKGFEFLKANLDISAGQLDFEFNRYLGWPGQAPSYKLGQRLWEDIRDARAARDGSGFSLRDFHTQALNLGSVGLDTLKMALLG
ncbi:uncharacterized protein (DUF885 family) [Arthrobacter stackebrandtii]|uniref:Uncharacterized protein (DUF885 family) n=1 Tax=Arthrobacter stackebrandtii TaxID=272161 RepID=A0ABS4YRN9_9MICC|nr:DUF885 domain-containing protein [Arthrobacter stackebrandtii]MBP2411459.1 uncharacterized protein (DUF885 family) [Arthrobacter stackebrandtii]PYH00262.1 DUF885 domain-containing protein [Arthrobacter stackebrandtii]